MPQNQHKLHIVPVLGVCIVLTLANRCKVVVRAVFLSTRSSPSELASLEARSLYWNKQHRHGDAGVGKELSLRITVSVPYTRSGILVNGRLVQQAGSPEALSACQVRVKLPEHCSLGSGFHFRYP